MRKEESHSTNKKNKSKMKAPLPQLLVNVLEQVPDSERIGNVVCWVRDDGERLPSQYMRKTWNRCIRLAVGINNPSAEVETKTVMQKWKEKFGTDELPMVHDLRRTACTLWYEAFKLEGRFNSRHKSVDAFLKYVRKQDDKYLDQVDQTDYTDSSILDQSGDVFRHAG